MVRRVRKNHVFRKIIHIEAEDKLNKEEEALVMKLLQLDEAVPHEIISDPHVVVTMLHVFEVSMPHIAGVMEKRWRKI